MNIELSYPVPCGVVDFIKITCQDRVPPSGNDITPATKELFKTLSFQTGHLER